MKFQKTINLLKTTSDNKDLPRSATKTKVYDRSEKNYSNNKENQINIPFVVLSVKHNSIA